MEFLYAYFTFLTFNTISILIVSTYLMYFLIPKIYKESKSEHQALKEYLASIKPLSKADIFAQHLVPFYGMFVSFYLIYLVIFDEDLKLHSISMKFKIIEQKLNKVRIFKRKE